MSLPFPRSLPEFQRLFPNDAACADYLERIRWPKGFVCPKCAIRHEPFRFEARPGVLRWLMPSSLAFERTASSERPSLNPATRVGVFSFAIWRSCLTSPEVHCFPELRVDLLIGLILRSAGVIDHQPRLANVHPRDHDQSPPGGLQMTPALTTPGSTHKGT